MLRSILAAAAFAAIAAPAFASNSYTFETVNPLSEKRIVAESVVWSCAGTTCTAECIAQGAEESMCRRVCSCIVEDLAGGPLLADRAAPLSPADERRLSEAIDRCRAKP